MADDNTNLVLEHLRRIRQTLDDMRDDVNVLKVRSSAVEQSLSAVTVHLSAMNHRMDRFDERMARIERRLDLVDA